MKPAGLAALCALGFSSDTIVADTPSSLLERLEGVSACSTEFYTPNTATCSIRINNKSTQAPQSAGCVHVLGSFERAHVGCVTVAPRSWHSGFMMAHVLRRSNVPSFGEQAVFMTEEQVHRGGASAFGQGWMSLREDALLNLNLGGTCGQFCEIAASVAGALAALSDEPPETTALLDVRAESKSQPRILHLRQRPYRTASPYLHDSHHCLQIGSGVSTLATCLASNHGIGTVVSVVPCDFPPCEGMAPLTSTQHEWEAKYSGRGSYQHQSFVSTERGAPTLLDVLTHERALPLQSGGLHAIFSCRAAGGVRACD